MNICIYMYIYIYGYENGPRCIANVPLWTKSLHHPYNTLLLIKRLKCVLFSVSSFNIMYQTPLSPRKQRKEPIQTSTIEPRQDRLNAVTFWRVSMGLTRSTFCGIDRIYQIITTYIVHVHTISAGAVTRYGELRWHTHKHTHTQIQTCMPRWIDPNPDSIIYLPWPKWPPFRRRSFQLHFSERKVCISIRISLKFVPRGAIKTNLAFSFDNELVRQAIIWTNAVPVHRRIMQH